MKCVKCKGKCSTLKTIHEVEYRDELVSKQGEGEGLEKYEVKYDTEKVPYPVVKRLHKCKDCGCRFYTIEKFDCFTEWYAKEEMKADLTAAYNAAVQNKTYQMQPDQKKPVLKINSRRIKL